MKESMFVTLLLMALLLVHCQKETTALQKEPPSYTPLAVGDEWQMVNLLDSSTVDFKVVESRIRIDNLKVFAVVAKVGNVSSDTLFFAIKNGYLLNTNFYPLREANIPAFWYVYLARQFPRDEDIWFLSSTDSNVTIQVKLHGKLTLPWGFVDQVFKFEVHNPIASYPLPVTYYAPGLGQVATGSRLGQDDIRLEYICTFRKTGGKIFGKRWPEKLPDGDFKTETRVAYILGIRW